MSAAHRATFQALGRHASIELSPAQICGHSDRSLLATLDKANPSPSFASAGRLIYVNMVKKRQDHFTDVARAVSGLAQRGLVPIAHVPACRFDDAVAAEQWLQKLRKAGAAGALVIGGNDQRERQLARSSPFPGAGELLATGLLRPWGWVGIAGHPEGHPGLSNSKCQSEEVLLHKLRACLLDGLPRVCINSQLCFDPAVLVPWLHDTRTAVARTLAELDSSGGGGGADMNRVIIRIAAPGPTRRSNIQRIAALCGVSPPPATHGDSSALVTNTGDDGRGQGIQKGHHASGPSIFVDSLPPQPAAEDADADADTDVDAAVDESVWPHELICAVASYCEQQGVAVDGEGEGVGVALHVLPFEGGFKLASQMIMQLEDGVWPTSAAAAAAAAAAATDGAGHARL